MRFFHKSIVAFVSLWAGTTLSLADELWNFHVQNTEIFQGYPSYSALYNGPHSLPAGGQGRETVSLDVMSGGRLWSGAEAHVDALMWQGFGVANTLGAEGFPSAEAYRLGTNSPNGSIARIFIRQTIGLGGPQEDVSDDLLTLAGKQDISRLTITLGRFASPDIFDTNTYANSARTQFMNWGLVNNLGWDYPADTIGYDSGIAFELNQPKWALRYGFFEVPSIQNGLNADDRYFKWPYDPSANGPSKGGPLFLAWGMVTELEHRNSLDDRPGAVRLLAYVNRADMARYSDMDSILETSGAGGDISGAQTYHYKYGFGLNAEQEVAKGIGVFSRIGWNDGQEQGYMFTDVAYTASLGVSVNGQSWHRPGDTWGLAGVTNGISHDEQRFLQAGGLGILGGDGQLNYGWEKILETYYDVQIWKMIHTSFDYQFIDDPAFNRDRGPVSFFALRLHWQY
jgi:high affinity Mn2+ porin